MLEKSVPYLLESQIFRFGRQNVNLKIWDSSQKGKLKNKRRLNDSIYIPRTGFTEKRS